MKYRASVKTPSHFKTLIAILESDRRKILTVGQSMISLQMEAKDEYELAMQVAQLGKALEEAEMSTDIYGYSTIAKPTPIASTELPRTTLVPGWDEYGVPVEATLTVERRVLALNELFQAWRKLQNSYMDSGAVGWDSLDRLIHGVAQLAQEIEESKADIVGELSPEEVLQITDTVPALRLSGSSPYEVEPAKEAQA